MMKLTCYFVFALCSVLITFSATAQDRLLVDTGAFLCFLNNIEIYAATEESGVVVVIFDKCPDASLTPSDITNMAVAIDPITAASTASAEQNIVIVSGAELDCLTQHRVSILTEIGTETETPLTDLLAILSGFCR